MGSLYDLPFYRRDLQILCNDYDLEFYVNPKEIAGMSIQNIGSPLGLCRESVTSSLTVWLIKPFDIYKMISFQLGRHDDPSGPQ